jgi:hypothetical protein
VRFSITIKRLRRRARLEFPRGNCPLWSSLFLHLYSTLCPAGGTWASSYCPWFTRVNCLLHVSERVSRAKLGIGLPVPGCACASPAKLYPGKGYYSILQPGPGIPVNQNLRNYPVLPLPSQSDTPRNTTVLLGFAPGLPSMGFVQEEELEGESAQRHPILLPPQPMRSP